MTMPSRSRFTRSLTLALSGALAAALLATPAARASDAVTGGPRSYASLAKMKPMEAMHAMDAGKKGYVTHAEFLAYHEALFDRMDRDKDGKVTDSEWVAKVHTAP